MTYKPLSMVPFLHPWPEKPLGELATVVVGGTPSTDVPTYWGGDIPWMASGDVHQKRITDVEGRITGLGLRSSNATLVEPPSVAVALAGQGKTRGTAAKVLTRLCANQSVALIAGKPGALHPDYLFHNLDFRYEELRARSSGGGRGGLSKGILEETPFPTPDLAEQARIAEVLDTLDQAIRVTEVGINKREQARLALIYDLLRFGIDEHGVVRSSQCNGFQDTSLGPIPTSWVVAPFDHYASPERPVIKTGPFGSTLKGTDWTDTGVPVITIGALGEGDVDPSQLLYVSEEKARRLSAYVVQEGDLLFSRVADVGRSIVVSARESGWIMSSNLMWISLDQSKVDPHFAWLSLTKGPSIRSQIRRSLNAGGREVANGPILRSLRLAWPELHEQRRIVAIEQNARAGIRVVKTELAKLHALKSGLASDLLTGRIRTPVGGMVC